MAALVDMLCRSRPAQEYLLSEAREDHTWFQIEWAPPPETPLFVEKIEPRTLRRIESIHITRPCKVQITESGMRRAKLGDVQLAWGKTDILGHDAIVVATKDKSGVEKLSVNMRRNPALPDTVSPSSP
jgi:hypothetical protein